MTETQAPYGIPTSVKFPKPKRYENDEYLAWIRTKPCMNCYKAAPSVSHHCSHISGSGQGTKPSDLFAIPLCSKCHQDLHAGAVEYGEWWTYSAITIARLLGEWIERGMK